MTAQRDHDLDHRVADWLTQRVPAAWLSEPPQVELDRDEILVILPLAQDAPDREFRERTRDERIRIARQAEETFGRKLSWGTVRQGDRRLFTTVVRPVTSHLAMPERRVLDTLVDAGVAADRSDAVAWAIRLVGQHEADWLRDLRDATAPATIRPERTTHF